MWPIVTNRVAWSVFRSVTLVSPAKTAELIEMPFGLWAQMGPRNHVLDGVHIPIRRGILGERAPIVKYRDFLPWAVQKLLHQSICRLGCGLGWAKGSTNWIGFARWQMCPPRRAHWRHLANAIEPSVCGGNAAFCQTTFTTCYNSVIVQIYDCVSAFYCVHFFTMKVEIHWM